MVLVDSVESRCEINIAIAFPNVKMETSPVLNTSRIETAY